MNRLGAAVRLAAERPLSELESQGLIQAFHAGIINDGEIWMEMIKSRNESSHTYNIEVANRISEAILDRYWPLFASFLEGMSQKESAA